MKRFGTDTPDAFDPRAPPRHNFLPEAQRLHAADAHEAQTIGQRGRLARLRARVQALATEEVPPDAGRVLAYLAPYHIPPTLMVDAPQLGLRFAFQFVNDEDAGLRLFADGQPLAEDYYHDIEAAAQAVVAHIRARAYA